MAEEIRTIAISDTPELRRLAEEVYRTREPRALIQDSEVLAVVIPAAPRMAHSNKEPSESDEEAFRSAAGGWKGIVDTDKLIEDVYESRSISTRPPVEL